MPTVKPRNTSVFLAQVLIAACAAAVLHGRGRTPAPAGAAEPVFPPLAPIAMAALGATQPVRLAQACQAGTAC